VLQGNLVQQKQKSQTTKPVYRGLMVNKTIEKGSPMIAHTGPTPPFKEADGYTNIKALEKSDVSTSKTKKQH
jgi:hypothetical protein